MLEMCERVTSKKELRDLGSRVLNLPERTIQTALHDNRTICDATYDVLSSWRKQHQRGQDAYYILYTGLRRCGMYQWAAQMQALARESDVTTRAKACSEKGSWSIIFGLNF